MTEESFVSFGTANLLKDAGFDVPCVSIYIQDDKGKHWQNIAGRYVVSEDMEYNARNYYLAPTQALAARWLREVHRIVVDVAFVPPSVDGDVWQCFVGKMDDMVWAGDYELSDCKYATYEEAFEYGLKRGLELIKK